MVLITTNTFTRTHAPLDIILQSVAVCNAAHISALGASSSVIAELVQFQSTFLIRSQREFREYMCLCLCMCIDQDLTSGLDHNTDQSYGVIFSLEIQKLVIHVDMRVSVNERS